MAILISVPRETCAAIARYFERKPLMCNKNFEKIAVLIIRFLGSWFAIAVTNYRLSASCDVGKQIYKKCDNMFDDITCIIAYVQTLACPLNRLINSVGSFGFTLGIFSIGAFYKYVRISHENKA